MKKIFLTTFTITTLLFTTTVTFAKENENSNGKSGEVHGKSKVNVQEVEPIPTIEPTLEPTSSPNPTVAPTATPTLVPNPSCDPNGSWNNHGQYVSCVARGGKSGEAGEHGKRVREAAHSDVGKKQHSPSPSVSPSASPSATPSVSPSPTPPITSAIDTFNFQALNLQATLERIIGSLNGLLNSLKNLLPD